MEEKKLKRVNSAKQEEPTVEQLKNYCDQLLAQRNQLAEQLSKTTNVLNKLPILFEVIKYKEVFPDEFVQACVNEVMLIMLPPKEEKKGEEEESPKK